MSQVFVWKNAYSNTAKIVVNIICTHNSGIMFLAELLVFIHFMQPHISGGHFVNELQHDDIEST